MRLVNVKALSQQTYNINYSLVDLHSRYGVENIFISLRSIRSHPTFWLMISQFQLSFLIM